jgi:hypothetical protein
MGDLFKQLDVPELTVWEWEVVLGAGLLEADAAFAPAPASSATPRTVAASRAGGLMDA